jgi:tetratricopeptide (TPR) repeat protein
MRKIIITVLLLFHFCLFISAQSSQKEKVLDVSVESRNKAIDYLNNARKLSYNNQQKESLTYFIAAIKTDSTLTDTYESLYRTSTFLKNYSDSVLNCFYIGKRVYFDDDEISFFTADILRFRKEYKKAIDEYTNAIGLSKNEEEKSFLLINYFTGRAISYVKTNQYYPAIEDYSAALKIDPENELVLINRGVCYQKLEDNKKAVADWEKAVALGSTMAKEYLEKLRK